MRCFAPGLFTGHGRDAVGELWWDDLGVDLVMQPPAAWLNEDLSSAPLRQHRQHKGSFGDVRVVGGAAQMVGAALLAGRAALHAGAGRVYVHPRTGPRRPRCWPVAAAGWRWTKCWRTCWNPAPASSWMPMHSMPWPAAPSCAGSCGLAGHAAQRRC